MKDYTDITAEDVELSIEQRIIGRNAARNRNIMRSVLIDGLTYQKTAEKYDLSIRQIAYIVQKCEYLIFKGLK